MRRAWRFPIPGLVSVILMTTVGLARTAPRASEAVRMEGDGDLHMKLEKTWLGVDVVEVDVWFDGQTREDLRRLASGQPYSDRLADRIAREALTADLAYVRIEFLRDVSLREFLDSVRQNLTRARDAGLITAAIYDDSWRRVREAFGRLAKRGFQDGDRLEYRARSGALRTTLVSSGGRVVLDVTAETDTARRALLAGYFAPGGDFRKPLIRSLFG